MSTSSPPGPTGSASPDSSPPGGGPATGPRCPHCESGITRALSDWGGRCPSCGETITGDEALTEPGVQPPAGPPSTELPAPRPVAPSRGLLLAVLAVGVVAVALCGAWAGGLLGLRQLEGGGGEAPEPTIASPEVGAGEALPDPTVEEPEGAETGPDDASAESDEVAVVPEAVAEADAEPPATPRARPAASRSAPAPEASGPPAEALTDPVVIQEMIDRVMADGAGALRACYDARLAEREDLMGAWKVSFQVGHSRRAEGLRVQPLGMADAGLVSCLEREVSGWRFQPVASPVTVVKSYRFSPGF